MCTVKTHIMWIISNKQRRWRYASSSPQRRRFVFGPDQYNCFAHAGSLGRDVFSSPPPPPPPPLLQLCFSLPSVHWPVPRPVILAFYRVSIVCANTPPTINLLLCGWEKSVCISEKYKTMSIYIIYYCI